MNLEINKKMLRSMTVGTKSMNEEWRPGVQFIQIKLVHKTDSDLNNVDFIWYAGSIFLAQKNVWRNSVSRVPFRREFKWKMHFWSKLNTWYWAPSNTFPVQNLDPSVSNEIDVVQVVGQVMVFKGKRKDEKDSNWVFWQDFGCLNKDGCINVSLLLHVSMINASQQVFISHPFIKFIVRGS